MGKGCWKRRRSITREEDTLRDDYMRGKITKAVFNRRFAKLRRIGLIQRSGRVLK